MSTGTSAFDTDAEVSNGREGKSDANIPRSRSLLSNREAKAEADAEVFMLCSCKSGSSGLSSSSGVQVGEAVLAPAAAVAAIGS